MSVSKTMVVIGFLFSLKSLAQDTVQVKTEIAQPPVPLEIFTGHEAMSYQHVLNKNLLEGNFNFFNVTGFDAAYEQNENNVFVISSLFSYTIGKGFSAGLGGEIQRPGTFAIAGAQYAYATQRFLLVVFPSVNLNGKTQYSQFTLLEYRPKINEMLNGYIRTQWLLATDFQRYERGYQQFRLGLQIKHVQFGLAANFDQFDSNAITTSNYGVFVRILIY